MPEVISPVDNEVVVLADGFSHIGTSEAPWGELVDRISTPQGRAFLATNRTLKEVNKGFRGLLLRIVKMMIKRRTETLSVVDIACGTKGKCAETLAKKFGKSVEVTGLDVALRKEMMNRKAKLHIADATALAIESESADVVYSKQFMTYLGKNEAIASIQEAVRISKGVCLLDILGDHDFTTEELENILAGYDVRMNLVEGGLFLDFFEELARILGLLPFKGTNFLVTTHRSVPDDIVRFIERY